MSSTRREDEPTEPFAGRKPNPRNAGRKRGPIYDHFSSVASKMRRVACKFCGTELQQDPRRMRSHLGSRCSQVPPSVREHFRHLVELEAQTNAAQQPPRSASPPAPQRFEPGQTPLAPRPNTKFMPPPTYSKFMPKRTGYTMQNLRAGASKSAETLLAMLPQSVSRLQGLQNKHFRYNQPGQVRLMLSTVDFTTNQDPLYLKTLINTVEEELQTVVSTLQALISWWQLQMVGDDRLDASRKQVAFQLEEGRARWQQAWDHLPQFYVDKARSASSNPFQSSPNTNEGHESTTGSVLDVTEDDTSVELPHDTYADLETTNSYRIAVEVKWYFNFSRIIDGIRDQYFVISELVSGSGLEMGDTSRATGVETTVSNLF